MIDAAVKNLLETKMWDLGTCSSTGEPNVVPVAFKKVTEEGTLLVGDVFLETTLKNLAENNGALAISVFDDGALEGYQIKGTAVYVEEGPIVEEFKQAVESMFNGAATAKGALVITPQTVIVTTPGPDNKKAVA